MRVVLATAMITLMATSAAFAQDNHVQRYGEADKPKTQTEIQAQKDADRAYNRSLNNIPDKGPTDPWGAVRTTDAPKATKKTKTGAAN